MPPEESDNFTPAMRKVLPQPVITTFLCGDVMTGRGIDQVLPHPCEPGIYEAYLRSAADYVQLAEEANGPIAKPVAYPYIWGDALQVLAEQQPDLRIVNLETSADDQQRLLAGQRRQLPDASGKYRLPDRSPNRLLHPGQQSCARLGPLRPG